MLPPKIKAGDCIGIFSPSSPATFFAKERYGRAKRFLTDKGFHIIDDFSLPHTLPTPAVWTDEFVPWGEKEQEKSERSNTLITLNSGVAEGRIIAGNLNTMQGIWGSKYMPEIKEGDILLIEDSQKNMATVERSFSLLKINEIFDKIAGLIIGKHELFDDSKTNRKHYEVLLEVMGDTRIPVLAEFDCSHTKPMLTLPIGCRVKLDAGNKQVSITGIDE